MAEKSKKRGREGVEAIDLQLDGLLGKLGSTISDLVGRLERGETGEVNRSHSFQTEKGPIRAETGIRIRMGGLEGAAGATTQPVDRPATRPAEKPAQAKSAEQTESRAAAPRDAEAMSYIENGRFILTAELPGVSLAEVSLRAEAGDIVLETTGPRAFRARLPLPAGADLSDMETALRNGILVASIAIAGPAQ